MKQKLNGISLILFSILFYMVSGDIQACFWRWGIGVAVPWGVIALLIGMIGIIFTFGKERGRPKS